MRKNLLLNVLAIGAVAVGLASCGGNSGSKELTIVHFDQAILGETQKDLGVSIGIKKGNTTLQTALNEALATISVDTRNQWIWESESTNIIKGEFNENKKDIFNYIIDYNISRFYICNN